MTINDCLFMNDNSSVTKFTYSNTMVRAKSFMGGFFIAMGGLCSTIAGFGLTGGICRAISALVFPIGLIFIILTGAELFTGDILMFNIIKKKKTYLYFIIEFLIKVYVWNFLGSIMASLLFIGSGVYNLFDYGLAVSLIKTASTKLSIPLFQLLPSAILCNFCVCLAVLFSKLQGSSTKKLPLIMLPIFTFVICGFEHIVADMYYITGGLILSLNENLVALAGISTAAFSFINIIEFLLIVTIGNILGGVALLLILYWMTAAQKDNS